MKTVKKEITTYKEIYVSNDGKEFENEADCKSWENSYKATLRESFAKLAQFEVNSNEIGLAYSSDDQEVIVVMPQTIDDIVLLNAFIASETCYDSHITTDMIGKTLALNFGYDRDYCDVYCLEAHLEHLTKCIRNIIAKSIEKNSEKLKK